MSIWGQVKKLFRYLLGKRSELEDLDFKDVVLAKTVLDIHRKRTHKEVIAVPLFALRQIHVLDRENALEATRRRALTLEPHKDELRAAVTLTCDVLARLLPSVSWIKVVKEGDDSYLAFEGNGRIAALQRVFKPEDGLRVEVEEYKFRNNTKIVRRLNRVRRLNGLLVSRGP